ncbi:hypothetical protein EC526_06005 [Helicobacter pylori]|nr:hypothetical protein EC526_06005 [Helicobacter pylori]
MILFIYDLLSKPFEKGFLVFLNKLLSAFKNRMLVLECVIYQLDEETITTAIAKPASWLMLALKLWILK